MFRTFFTIVFLLEGVSFAFLSFLICMVWAGYTQKEAINMILDFLLLGF